MSCLSKVGVVWSGEIEEPMRVKWRHIRRFRAGFWVLSVSRGSCECGEVAQLVEIIISTELVMP